MGYSKLNPVENRRETLILQKTHALGLLSHTQKQSTGTHKKLDRYAATTLRPAIGTPKRLTFVFYPKKTCTFVQSLDRIRISASANVPQILIYWICETGLNLDPT